MSIEKMLQEYKTTAEMQAFAEAQFKTIQDLNKKLKRLEDEKQSLQKMLDGMVPNPKKDEQDFAQFLASSDQETIAKIQINKLKEISFEREMTLEETKRFEIFCKVLNGEEEKNKTLKAQSKRLDEADLLKLLEDEHKVN